jgi:hypothetical protein
MFADRIKEDKALAITRPGILDGFINRLWDRHMLRVMADAATRLFTPGRSLYFRLGQGKYLALTGVRYCKVTCARGAVWVTATGYDRDRVLTPGQSVTLARGGKVVITGRGDASEVKVRWD